MISHGMVESNSSSVSKRTSHDKTTITNILLPLANYLPLNVKLVRIGKPRPDSNRPFILVCANEEEAKPLLYQYNELKRTSTQFLNGFYLFKDKTQLERQQSCTCHNEIASQSVRGKLNLCIY